MPDFPRYESQGAINTSQQVGALAPEDPSYKKYEAAAETGKQLGEIGLKFAVAHDQQKQNEAELGFKTGMNEVLMNAQNDPNPDNQEKYLSQIQQLQETHGDKKFVFGATKGDTSARLGYEASTGSVQVQNIFRNKIIDKAQADTYGLLDDIVSKGGPGMQQSIKATLDKQVKSGIFDRVSAYNVEKKYVKAYEDQVINKINKDLYSAKTPEEVDAVRESIVSGSYEDGGVSVDPEKKRALLGIADSTRKNAERRIKAQEVEDMAKTRVDTIAGVASGQMDVNNLNIGEIAEYDPKLGAMLQKTKDFMTNYNPKEPGKPSMQGILTPSELMKERAYAKSINDVFNQVDNERLGEFVLRELEKKGDGSTPSIKLAAFMQLAAMKRMANNPQTKDDSDAADRLNQISAGIAFLKSSNPYLAPYVLGDFIVRNFHSGSASPEDVMNEAKAALKNRILGRHPSVSKLPSMPNKIVDGNASVEDIHSGVNDLKDGSTSADYGD